MAKWVCSVCGYVHEGDEPPKECPMCHAGADKFEKQETTGELVWACEHKIGIAKEIGAPTDMIEHLKSEFQGECSEVGMYLAMARQAFREGYPEIGDYYTRAAYEEADHAARYAELVGEVLKPSTKENLKMRYMAENGACAGKYELPKKAKELNLDAIHEMSKDEARHGKAFKGLYDKYFG